MDATNNTTIVKTPPSSVSHTSTRKTAFSTCGIDALISADETFNKKLGKAFAVINEEYGADAVKKCIAVENAELLNKNGNPDVDVNLDFLTEMLLETESQMKRNCWKQFCTSMKIHGSIAYFIGGISFGILAFYQALPREVKVIFALIGVISHVYGACIFIWLAIAPYWKKQKYIHEVAQEAINLQKTKSTISIMRASDSGNKSRICTKLSNLGLEVKPIPTDDTKANTSEVIVEV